MVHQRSSNLLHFISGCLFFVTFLLSCNSVKNQSVDNNDSPYLEAVEIFAQNIIENGRDTYGEKYSPLFADGIEVRTGEPVRWEFHNNSFIISNFASQQNLLRVLDGLTILTGDSKYREAAASATEYMFDNHTDSSGLLYWGGHQFIDLQTMQNQFKGRPHELKTNFPYYEFLWSVDEEATRKMLRAIWNAHILNWNVLDLNRHGEYNAPVGKLWEHDFDQPPAFYEGEGLTFINAGTDLIQVALSLFLLDDDEGAKKWGIRLYNQYVRARHLETQLGVYQYSRPKQTEEPPYEGPLTGELTFSKYGDRAQNQFGRVYGEIALEGNVLWGGRMNTLYGQSPIMMMYLSGKLQSQPESDSLISWTLEGMTAYAKFGYNEEKNIFKPMWADGTDLSDDTIPRTGYFGKKGEKFDVYEPEGATILAYVRALRYAPENNVLWNVVRNMLRHEDLGDIKTRGEDDPALNFATKNADPELLISLLELYKITGHENYLQLAEQMGDNILNKKFHHGYFMPSEKHRYAKFDAHEPLALLHLEAARRGITEEMPAYLTGTGETDGEPELGGRPTDQWLYEEKVE